MPLRVAVIGAGHLGSRHAEKLARLPRAQLVAVCDVDTERAGQIARSHTDRQTRQAPAVIGDFRELLGPERQVDAVTIATPTASHHEVASACLEAGVHAMVEKPITRDVAAGEDLVRRARERGLRLAVGHVERFNPAMRALSPLQLAPRYVESYRISPFSFRSMDIGVVHDLMIHDLDIILHLIDRPVERVEAHGVAVLGDCEDIANARLLFDDGSVATATASRVSLKRERKVRLFAEQAYVTMDLDKRSVRVLRKGEKLRNGEIDIRSIDPRTLANPLNFVVGKLIDVQNLKVTKEDALEAEIDDFLAAVEEDRDPLVTGEQGVRALEVAERVVAEVEESLARAAAGRSE